MAKKKPKEVRPTVEPEPDKEVESGDWKSSEGKRFVISLQNKLDYQCYNDLEEIDKWGEAKEIAERLALENERPTIVFDRRIGFIVYRFAPPLTEEQELEQQTKVKKTPSIRRK